MATPGIKYLHDSKAHNLRSPGIIVPKLIELLSPKSVIDIGCGWGTFLHVFEKNGITDIFGIDGAWVKEEDLFIKKENFAALELEKPIVPERQFDLVLCLEVAEHLDENAADTLIETLIGFGNTIVFSAAIKGQRGQNHVNEQMHDYWQKKFLNKGYVYYDALRPFFWNDENIDVWYKQNIFLVAHQSIIFNNSINATKVSYPVSTFVHPDLLAIYDKQNSSLVEENELLKTSLIRANKTNNPIYFVRRLIDKVFK